MLNVVLFSTDPGLAALVRSLSDESIEFTLERLVDSPPTGFEIARMLATSSPDVILLEVRDPDRDLACVRALRTAAPSLPVVALTSRDVVRGIDAHPDCGIAETIVWPFTVVTFENALERAVHKMQGARHENLFAFLPGKAGSGASTVVFHTACALAACLEKRPLVIEGDLHSGLLATVLNATLHRNVRQALQNSKRMDAAEWPRYLVQARGVDFTLADPAIKEPIPAWSHYYHLLRFAAPRYDAVLVDLPEVVNNATAESVRTAKAVYIVSTPELPSLTLARQRCHELAHWGVDSARIFAILNRWHKHDISARDAEEILEHPVAAVFPNDYRSIQRSFSDGRPLEQVSELGAAYTGFARKLIGMEGQKAAKATGLFARFRAS